MHKFCCWGLVAYTITLLQVIKIFFFWHFDFYQIFPHLFPGDQDCWLKTWSAVVENFASSNHWEQSSLNLENVFFFLITYVEIFVDIELVRDFRSDSKYFERPQKKGWKITLRVTSSWDLSRFSWRTSRSRKKFVLFVIVTSGIKKSSRVRTCSHLFHNILLWFAFRNLLQLGIGVGIGRVDPSHFNRRQLFRRSDSTRFRRR